MSTQANAATWRKFSSAVIASSFLMMFINTILSGSSFFTTYLPEITGWSRSQIVLPYTVGNFLNIILIFIASATFQKYNPRYIISGATVVYGIAMFLMSIMDGSYAIYFVGGILCCIANTFLNLGGTFVLCGRWFNTTLGRVLGFVTIGAPLCNGFLMNALIRYIASFADAATGLFTTCKIMAVFCIGVAIVFYLIIRGRPEDVGCYPDGAAEPPKVDMVNSELSEPWTFKRVITNRIAISLCVGFGLLSCVTSGVMTVFIRALLETGMDIVNAANYLTIASVLAIILSFVSGFVDDKIGTRTTTLICCFVYIILGVALFMVVKTGNSFWVLISAVCIAFGIGTVPNLDASFANRVYGRTNFLSAHRFVGTIKSLIVMPFSTIMASLYDFSGDYSIAFALCGVISVIAFILILGCNRSFSPEYISAHNGDDRIR